MKAREMKLWRRRGRPLMANGDHERCMALTVMTEWKIANKREQRCPFQSKYAAGHKELCRHHAVMEAMAIAMERGDVRRIQRPVPKMDKRVSIAAAKRWEGGKR